MNSVWVVLSLFDDTPTFMSVHTDDEQARAAREAYIKDYRYGGDEADYRIHEVKLNYTGLEGV